MSAYESSLAPSCAGGGFFYYFIGPLHRLKQSTPRDASDASSYTLDKDYTNIEVYLNSLLKKNL